MPYKNPEERKEYFKSWRLKNKIKMKQYNSKNRKKHRLQQRQYRKDNLEKIRLSDKQRYERDKEKRLNGSKDYYNQNKVKILAYRKKYYQKNKAKILDKNKIYALENEEKVHKYQKDYRKSNHKSIIKNNISYEKDKRKSDPQFRTMTRLRALLTSALRRYSKTGKYMTSDKYSIDYKAIIEHLKPFPEDLNKYHIDHIKALCSFNLDDPEEIKKAFAPENHRWLLIEDNIKKSLEDKKNKFNCNYNE